MNDICRNIFPDSPVGYKISFDEKLRDAGIELFNLLDDANCIPDTFPDLEPHSYRRAFVHSSHHSKLVQESDMPEEIYKHFKKTFVDYLGIDSNCVQLKVEELIQHPLTVGLEDRYHRMANIWPKHPDKADLLPEGYRFGTGLWHTDTGCNLNNMVFLMYVSDVQEDMGGFVISEPPQKVGWDVQGKRGAYIGSTEPVRSNEIPCLEITGSAGTIVGFNSHTLHRANLPKRGKRRAIHMNILSNYPEHIADGYIPGKHKMPII